MVTAILRNTIVDFKTQHTDCKQESQPAQHRLLDCQYTDL